MPTIRRTSRWWKLSKYLSTGGSVPMFSTQIESLISPLTQKTYPPFSYLLHPFPKYLLVFPISPAPYLVSVTLKSNHCWRTRTFALSNWTKEPPSAVYHIPIRPSPSITPYPQYPSSIASFPSRSNISLKLGAPNRVPLVGQTFHKNNTLLNCMKIIMLFWISNRNILKNINKVLPINVAYL